jgi:hypothetical protein
MFIIKPPPKNRTYWLSFDRRRCALRYGRGYHMEETVEKTWTLDLESNDSRGLSAGDKAALQKLFGRTVKMVGWAMRERPWGGGNTGQPLCLFDCMRVLSDFLESPACQGQLILILASRRRQTLTPAPRP